MIKSARLLNDDEVPGVLLCERFWDRSCSRHSRVTLFQFLFIPWQSNDNHCLKSIASRFDILLINFYIEGKYHLKFDFNVLSAWYKSRVVDWVIFEKWLIFGCAYKRNSYDTFENISIQLNVEHGTLWKPSPAQNSFVSRPGRRKSLN